MNADFWQEFLQGDEKAFSELYYKYFNELIAYGLKIGFGEEACKDAIQDVFHKIYISRKQLSHIRNIEFYLLQSVKNRLFDIHKSEAKNNPLNYDDIISENEGSIVEKIIEKEIQSQLKIKFEQSLRILPPKQRKIIYYQYQLNLSFAEIAILLEMKPEAVRKSAYRAIQKIKESRQFTNPFLLLSLFY